MTQNKVKKVSYSTNALQREYKKSLNALHSQIFKVIEYWLLPLFNKEIMTFDSKEKESEQIKENARQAQVRTEKRVLVKSLRDNGINANLNMNISTLRKLSAKQNQRAQSNKLFNTYVIGGYAEIKGSEFLGSMEIINIDKDKVILKDSLGHERSLKYAQVKPSEAPKIPYSKDDSFSTRFSKVKNNINSLTDKMSKTIAGRQMYAFLNNINEKFKQNIGIDFKRSSLSQESKDKLQMIYENNVNLIKSVPQDILESLESVLYNASFGGNNKQIREALSDVKDISKRRINTIARDQTSKALNAISTMRATEAGFVFYEWRTSEDERVSKGKGGHDKLNHKIFRYDTPEAEIDSYGNKGHPSQRVNCRCVAVPLYVYPNQKVIKDTLGYKVVDFQ